MLLFDIINRIETDIIPKSLGNINHSGGIQFGYGLKKRRIRKVMVTIFPSMDSISEAIAKKINLIISYYPIEGAPFWEIKEKIALKLTLLASGRIILYLINKTFEAAENGFIEILLNKLSLRKEGLFYPDSLEEEKIPLGRLCSPISFRETGKSFSLYNLLKRVKDYLSAKNIRYVGDKGQKITKICVMSSLSRDLMLNAINQDCQCYLTRDFKYTDALLAKDLNLSLVETGHHAETTVLKELCNRISLDFPMIGFYYYDFENPYSYFYNKNQDKKEVNQNRK